ncbi:MAG: hypothetical protein ACFNUC_04345 [Selenomonas noxia]
MESYVALLLFVMPGYLARLIYGHVEDGVLEKDKFRIVMESMLYNMAIIPIVYFMLLCTGRTLESPYTFFSVPDNVAVYAIYSTMAAIIAGIAWRYMKPWYVKGINRLRKSSNQNAIDIDKTVFDIAFNDGDVHWVEIHRDGEMLARGILGSMFTTHGELYIVDAEDCISAYTDENGKPKHYEGTYIDYKNNLVIKEISTK